MLGWGDRVRAHGRHIRCTWNTGKSNIDVHCRRKPSAETRTARPKTFKDGPDHLALKFQWTCHIISAVKVGHTSRRGSVMTLLTLKIFSNEKLPTVAQEGNLEGVNAQKVGLGAR